MDQQNIELLVKRIDRIKRRSRRIIAGLLFVVVAMALGVMAQRVRAQEKDAVLQGLSRGLQRYLDNEKGVACYESTRYINNLTPGITPPISCVKL